MRQTFQHAAFIVPGELQRRIHNLEPRVPRKRCSLLALSARHPIRPRRKPTVPRFDKGAGSSRTTGLIRDYPN